MNAKKAISRKHAEHIGELVNTITVARMFTDPQACNMKTPEGRDQWLRWHDNAVLAARTLRDVYGITIPGFAEDIDGDAKGTGLIRWMVKCDKEQAEHEARRALMSDAEKSKAAIAFLTENRSFNV